MVITVDAAGAAYLFDTTTGARRSGFTITGGHAIFIDEAVPAGEAVIVAQATALDGGPGRWISMTHLTDELKGFNAVGPGPNIGQARVGFVVLRIR